MKDYYAILGVERGLSIREIKRAYKESVRKWHPDLHPDDPACRTKIQEINEAYAVLSDPEKRASYNRQIEEGRIFESKGMPFFPDHDEHPFFSYFTRISEVLRKRNQKVE